MGSLSSFLHGVPRWAQTFRAELRRLYWQARGLIDISLIQSAADPAGGFGVMRDVSVSANHSLVTGMDFPL